MLAVGALLLAACDDGGSVSLPEEEPTQTARPTRTAVGPQPTIAPSTTATETPSATPADESDIGWGVATVEVESGEVATLYESADTFRPGLGQAFAPWPEPRNNGIWISPTTEEAVRYALDGEVVDRVEGWGVLESPRGQARSYFRAAGSDTTVTMIVERREGEPIEVDGLNVSNRTFSADGARLAWLDAVPDDGNLVKVLDLATGEVREIAEVTACACDGYHYIEWSPSGRYLAYEDPAYDDPSRQGIYLYDVEDPEAQDPEAQDPETQAPETRRPGYAATPVADGWVQADESEFLLVLEEGIPTLHPVDSEREPVVIRVDAQQGTGQQGAVRAHTLQDLVMVSTGTGPATRTLIHDPVSGEQLRELQGASDAVLTARGIATAVITRNDLTCTGIQIAHPDFEERLECTAEDVRWSPDGRYLALIPQAASDPVSILDVTTGDTTEIPHAGPRGTVPEWSEDGRYLVWVWGGQL